METFKSPFGNFQIGWQENLQANLNFMTHEQRSICIRPNEEIIEAMT